VGHSLDNRHCGSAACLWEQVQRALVCGGRFVLSGAVIRARRGAIGLVIGVVDLAPFSARAVSDDSRDASGSDKGERLWTIGRDWIGVGGGSGENKKGESVGVHGRVAETEVQDKTRSGGGVSAWPSNFCFELNRL
jgi:hypothetical protein